MATTVRQVKRLGKRNSTNNKLVPAPCWNIIIPHFGEVDGNGDKTASLAGGTYKLTPPPYRMPPQPLYSEPASIPGSATPKIQQIHTHSNKFPIEREVILSNYDKNSKIPILNEYHKKQAKSTAVAPDAPNIQMAWTEDRTRTYSEVRNAMGSNIPENIGVEFHRTYKAQPLSLLETTNGTEPSPIINQDDSNGFTSPSYSKSSGRSHSTPDDGTQQPAKPFPSRTYHTIKDMISSRFSKQKSDQIPETGLNNSESNETMKTENNNLSPHSQLVQRGVYLANSQQCNRNVNYGSNNNGNMADMAKRSQEVRDQIIGQQCQQQMQYRERGVDVGQTAGVSQQASSAVIGNNDNNCVAGSSKQYYQDCSNRATSRQSILDNETPNRFREVEQQNANAAAVSAANRRYEQVPSNGNVSRNIRRFQNTPGDMPSTSGTQSAVYSRPPIPTQRPHYVHSDNYPAQIPSTSKENLHYTKDTMHDNRTGVDIRNGVSGNHNAKYEEREYRKNDSQLPSDIKYNVANANAMERRSISRARSNDHLLEANIGKTSPYARKDLPLKQKSKSFENLGNDVNEDEVDKIDSKSSGPISGLSSDYEKHRGGGGQSDSGRGSTVYSSGKLKHTDTSPDSSEPHRITGNKDNQWVDMVENELKHILEPKSNASMANSTLSDSSTSPPLPPVSPDVSSDEMAPTYKRKNSLYGSKLETPYKASVPSSHHRNLWNSRSNTKEKIHQRLAVSMKRAENSSKIPSTVASSSIDLDSMLDEENNTSDEDISVTDTRAIRKQLEGLENMYTEVMKLLGVRKSQSRYQTDPRIHKRRLYGSMSSLPSSVSSRPIRDRHRRPEDRKKFVRDIKGINKRFQRLESHVVTLARSVAHLSSEMRTQHLMIQEMEVIRGELNNLRAQTNMLTVRSQSMPRFFPIPNAEQTNSSPDKMKKLTKFFGDEPPLLRLFLKKLGYEKYAPVFEKERVGLVELPYMSEERLQKLGIPMGPRLRILQEAQLGFPGAHENTLCIV
ncbi:uncharacterized protein LOC135839136 isoform X2 [Planococcus citri]|uniref:uncharacterized protein LOC135839136 isoform X2 n=1 Tax=Planococcus citri TaxID=170843 RepID=UPI0031F8909E